MWHILKTSAIYKLKPTYIIVYGRVFIVYVSPSKNKLVHLRTKIYLFTFTYCFLSNQALQQAH